MDDVFAALIFRAGEVPDEALSLGFGMALAGYDLERPRLELAELSEPAGYAVAFYASGQRGAGHGRDEELEHAAELFSGDLPPGAAVLAATRALTGRDVVIYGLVHGPKLDEASRFGGAGRGVVAASSLARDEADDETDDEEADDEEADDEEADDEEADEEPGSAFLERELGRPVLASLFRALFSTERRLAPRLADPSPLAVAAKARELVATLGRVPGRGASEPPEAFGAPPPEAFRAFAAAYDWADPADPKDLYRELALGRVEGTLRFLRPADLAALGAQSAAPGLYPFAELLSSNLASPRRLALFALAAPSVDGDLAVLRLDPKRAPYPAGPTFAELVRYLSLGWKKRDAFEEELIQCLMLRAAVRA